VGQRGIILTSADGKDWKQVPAPVDVMLTRVRFLDGDHGWAVGYDGAVLGTSNGGAKWDLLQFDAGWGQPYYDIHFFDPEKGLLVGANGTLKKTGDGGKTWEAVSSDVLADTPNLYNLIALGDNSLLLAGERGFLAQSTDQGATWRQLKSPYTGSFFGALASGPAGAVVFGLRGNTFYAPDLGKAPTITPAELEAIRAAAANPENATAAGNGPVSEVAGWTHLSSTDTEPLFGGVVGADGGVILVGQNGRVMRANLASGALERIPIGSDINMNAALVAGNGLITVGTSGINPLPVH
jgi:photosystem II stability/assembly factor-like uncharacterized protein